MYHSGLSFNPVIIKINSLSLGLEYRNIPFYFLIGLSLLKLYHLG